MEDIILKGAQSLYFHNAKADISTNRNREYRLMLDSYWLMFSAWHYENTKLCAPFRQNKASCVREEKFQNLLQSNLTWTWRGMQAIINILSQPIQPQPNILV